MLYYLLDFLLMCLLINSGSKRTWTPLIEWDRQIKNLDVVDDFRSERVEIKKKEGMAFRFSFGDYVVKSLIGSIDPTLDRMDEQNCCCNIL